MDLPILKTAANAYFIVISAVKSQTQKQTI